MTTRGRGHGRKDVKRSGRPAKPVESLLFDTDARSAYLVSQTRAGRDRRKARAGRAAEREKEQRRKLKREARESRKKRVVEAVRKYRSMTAFDNVTEDLPADGRPAEDEEWAGFDTPAADETIETTATTTTRYKVRHTAADDHHDNDDGGEEDEEDEVTVTVTAL
ncbi:hypothetical protein PYCC9005_004888 [Savitreella phatthalungensis]